MLVDLCIVGIIFGFYFWDIRKKDMIGMTYFSNRIFFIIGIGSLIIGIILAFSVIDGPIKTRNKKIDAEKTNSLRRYVSSIQSYYDKYARLPENLNEVEKDNSYIVKSKSETMTYQKTGNLNYKVCDNFLSSNLGESENNDNGYDYEFGYYYDKEFQHDKGNYCFDKEIKVRKQSASVSAQAEENNERKMIIVQTMMTSAFSKSIICKNSGVPISGFGNNRICQVEKNISQPEMMNMNGLVWPMINDCGTAIGDTLWIVENGNTDDWKITLNCKNFTVCNGAENAFCNKTGCVFSGTCKSSGVTNGNAASPAPKVIEVDPVPSDNVF